MSAEQLAKAVCEKLGIEPEHPEGVDATGRCHICRAPLLDENAGFRLPAPPCFAHVLHDLNEAWKILDWFDDFNVTKEWVSLWKNGLNNNDSVVESYQPKGGESLCLAIVRAAGKACGIKED